MNEPKPKQYKTNQCSQPRSWPLVPALRSLNFSAELRRMLVGVGWLLLGRAEDAGDGFGAVG